MATVTYIYGDPRARPRSAGGTRAATPPSRPRIPHNEPRPGIPVVPGMQNWTGTPPVPPNIGPSRPNRSVPPNAWNGSSSRRPPARSGDRSPLGVPRNAWNDPSLRIRQVPRARTPPMHFPQVVRIGQQPSIPNAWNRALGFPRVVQIGNPRPPTPSPRRVLARGWPFLRRRPSNVQCVPVPPLATAVVTPVFGAVPVPPYTTSQNLFAPTTFSMLTRSAVQPWKVVCRNCGTSWTSGRCPACSSVNPPAVPVYRYPVASQGGLRRRSSSNLRARATAQANQGWMPPGIDANAPFFSYGRARDEFDDVLDNITISPRDHPAGGEALVWTLGSPTPKLVSLCTAIHTWLSWTVPLTCDFIEARRLCFLEEQTENGGCFYTYNEDYHTTVFDEIGAEYLMYFDEHEQGMLPGLTLRGLLRYVTMWVLAEPRLAAVGLKRLVSIGNFPAPPPQYGPMWNIEPYMALGEAHPNAIDRLFDLHEKLFAIPGALLEPQHPDRQLWEPLYG